MREWLSGGASPCQGEGRGFESRLALQNNKKRISERISFFYYRGTSVPRRFEVYVPLRSAQNRGPPDLVRRLALLNNTKRITEWISFFVLLRHIRATAVG